MSIRINNIDGVGGFWDVPVTDRSYRMRQVMGDDNLYLYFSYEDYLDIATGAYVDFEGRRYYLGQPDNFKKHHSRNFDYTLVLESEQSNLSKYKVRDSAEKLLKFPLTAKPQQHLQLIVNNLNERESGWTVGTSIDASEKLISYNHTNLKEALQMIAEAFETEWEIDGKTINLRKVEYNKDTPLALSYGKGNGFKAGLGRINTDNKRATEVLHVQGGSRNIDYSKYGNSELLLPVGKTYTYEGREYITSADGRSIQRNDKPLSTGVENSLDCTHIYPSRVGSVSQVIVKDVDKHLYDFKDASIPEDLDFGQCMIAGETMTVVFQEGMLAGREFEIDSYVHSERLFRLVPKEQDGLALPDETFKPQIGEKYAVFGIQLPDAYIRNDTTQSGASWDMLKEAVKYLYENEESRFTFTGKLDGVWAKKDWLNIGGKIVPGGYVSFSDAQFQITGVLIRIVGIKDFVNNPHSPELELSNITTGGSVMSDIAKVKENEVVGDELHKRSISFTKRRFRSSQETIEMLSEAIDGYGKSINPLSIQSMSLLVGDESLQFRFVNDKVSPAEIIHSINFDNSTKILSADGGWIQHMSVGITTLSAGTHTYKFWDVDPFSSPALTDGTKPYYFYIKADKTNETAIFYISETAIKMEEVAGYYHFLVGFLNSEIAEERTFATMYGFSEVLPGRITTTKIHADTVEATEVLAQQIYASGATIGGVDIDPFEITSNGITGLRLGNLVSFSPTAGNEGIMLGSENGKYKMFVGNSTQNILFDGTNLYISGHALLGDGSQTVNDITAVNSMFEVVNQGQANEYIKCEVPFASSGEIQAFSDFGDFPPTLWDSMPIAGVSQLGGVKVGAGLNIDQYGVISVTEGGSGAGNSLGFTPSTGILTLKDINNTVISSQDISGISDLTNYYSKTSADDRYLSIGGTADNSLALGGYAASLYLRKAESASITGMWDFSNDVSMYARLTVDDDVIFGSSLAVSNAISEGGTSLVSKYLGIHAKADDSDKLDGFDSTSYMKNSLYNGYYGMVNGVGSSTSWIRTTTNGILPYQAGGYSSLGTSAWNFSNIYGVNIYDSNVLLEDKYLGIGAKADDSGKLDNLDSTQFLRSDVDDEVLGTLSYNDSSGYAFSLNRNSDYGAYFKFKRNGSETWTFHGGTGSGSDKFAINNSTGAGMISVQQDGNVGIGATSPTEKLDVNGNVKVSNQIKIDSGNGVSIDDGTGVFLLATNTGGQGIIKADAGHELRLYSNATQGAVLRSSGTFGIGITVPSDSYKLDVNGSIQSRNTGSNAVYSYGGYSVGQGYGRGIKFWNSDSYKIYMSTDGEATWGGSLVNDTDYHMYFAMTGGSNRGFVWKNNHGAIGQLSSNGNLYTKGEVTAYSSSDKRFKENVKDLSGLEKILALRPVEYDWNTLMYSKNKVKKGHDIGFIAQEVQDVIPEVVHTIYSDYLSLDYAKFTPHLVAAVKEQQREIERLRTIIEKRA